MLILSYDLTIMPNGNIMPRETKNIHDTINGVVFRNNMAYATEDNSSTPKSLIICQPVRRTEGHIITYAHDLPQAGNAHKWQYETCRSLEAWCWGCSGDPGTERSVSEAEWKGRLSSRSTRLTDDCKVSYCCDWEERSFPLLHKVIVPWRPS